MQVISQVTFSCAVRLHVEIPEFDPGYGKISLHFHIGSFSFVSER